MSRAASVLLVLVSILSPRGVFAQSEAGAAQISGAVRDASGQVVSGAAVTATNADTGLTRTTNSDARGSFVFPAIPVGTYAVEAALKGFATARIDGLVLSVGGNQKVDVVLKPASVSEAVTVTAESQLLDRTEGVTGTVLGQRAIADLPMRGRNFAEFIQLSPAVVQESDRFGLVISGQRSINSNVAIDGTDFNDPLQGNQRGGNETAFFFPQSAIREFQVVRSGAGAEVGRTGAGFVNVVTRSGTNRLQGDAFYFNRNKALTSKDAFDRKLNNEQNQFGGSLGGPIVSSKAFFFGAVEQNFLRVPFVVKFQPQAPGVVVPADLQALEGEQHGTNNPTAVFGRADITLNAANTLNVQPVYTHLTGENFNFDSPQLDTAASANFTRHASSAGVKGGWTSILGGRLVSEIRGQVATDYRLEEPNSFQSAIVISNFGTLGGDTGRPRRFDARREQITQNVTWNEGRHQMRFGWDVNVTHFHQERESNTLGRYDFTSLNNYVALNISRYRQTVAGYDAADLTYRGTGQEAALFAQDHITLGSRVTLNAGLRWEGQWNPTPARPNPALPETATIPNDLAMWQPRAGMTWDVRGTGRSILRLSTGIYASRTPANLFQRVSTDNGITTVAVDSRVDPTILQKVTFPNALPLLPPGTVVAPQRVFGFDPDFENPRTYQGAVTFEQQLNASTQVSVGYVHAAARQLQRRLDKNLFPPTLNAAGTPIFPSTRPNPAFAQIEINESKARADYHAMTLSFERRMSKRVQAQVHYTLASNKDDDSNERNFSRETTLNPFDPEAEYTWSKQDVRHAFNANMVVDIPAGFTASAILFGRSGFPYTAVIGSDQQRDANDDNDRAVIDGVLTARNGFRQPSFFDLDLRLVKALPFGTGRRLDLMIEVFNTTRASNKGYGNDSISTYGTAVAPAASFGIPLFAPSTARFGGPRQVQLGLRVNF